MSSENRGVTPLGPDDLMESPVMTMWKWHARNQLQMHVATTLECSYVHKRIGLEIVNKSHITSKSGMNKVFEGVKRHRNNDDLVLYGELLEGVDSAERSESLGDSSQ